MSRILRGDCREVRIARLERMVEALAELVAAEHRADTMDCPHEAEQKCRCMEAQRKLWDDVNKARQKVVALRWVSE